MLTKKEAARCEQVLRHLLYGEDTPLPPDTDWVRMGQIMAAHRMQSMTDCAQDPALRPLAHLANARAHAMYRHAAHETMKALFAEASRRGIRMAVIKGVVLEDCYPPDLIRNSWDIDLYIPDDQREAFNRIMQEQGMTLTSDIYKSQQGVDVFCTPSGLKIEVHYIIFRMFSARQRRILRKRGYFSADCLMPCTAAGIDCVTMKPEAHLVYLLYHTIKHMLHHGLRYRMLTDLTLFVNRWGDAIDWTDLRALIRELRCIRPVNALMCYCMRHLGMREDCWRKEGPALEPLVRLSLTSARYYAWERFHVRLNWPFYRSECVHTEDGYRNRHTYCVARAFKRKHLLATFTVWRVLRAIWGMEIDKTGEIE